MRTGGGKGLRMCKKIFSNTFASRKDCEMFLMVRKQQCPQMKGQLSGARLEIVHDTETPHMMKVVWTLKARAQAEQMTELSKDVILPYRCQLAPKSVTLEGDLNWSMEF